MMRLSNRCRTLEPPATHFIASFSKGRPFAVDSERPFLRRFLVGGLGAGWVHLPGLTAEIIVQAVNGRLQGVASDSVFFTVPPVTRTAEPKALEVGAVEVANGNGNGHKAHARA